VSLRAAAARARLRALAAEIDTRPSSLVRAAGAVRSRPWAGVGFALLVGVVLGATRRHTLPVVVPFVGRSLASGVGLVLRRRVRST